MSTLQEHLTEIYEVDVEEQIRLGSVLAHEEREAGFEHKPRFIIDDEDKANWALRKLARLEAERAAAEEQARLERERIATWLESQTAKLDREASFFKGLLEQFHRNELTADSSKKTIQLPAGALKARKAPDSIEILVDEDTFLDWASDERPDFVRVSRAIDRKALREAAIKDGESIPNVFVQPGEVRYSVEVSS